MRPRAAPPAVEGVARGGSFPASPLRGRAQAAILIADDDAATRMGLAAYIRRQGCVVETAPDLSAALHTVARAEFDVVFADVAVAGGDDALLAQIRALRPGTALVLMATRATVAEAVHAMQAGAYDYLVKPLDLEHVRMLLRRILQGKATLRGGRAGSETVEPSFVLESANAAMQKAIATAHRVAASDLPVLLTGECGTGKTVLATCIHAWSRRRAQSFATISCTALADRLAECERLGHASGGIGPWHDTPGWAEAASGGTLFLDEVCDVRRRLQGELFRLLADQHVGAPGGFALDARVIAATTHNLEAEVAAGRFREDLFFRLNVVAIAIPPLRERPEDLVALSDHFLRRLAARYGRHGIRISPHLRPILGAHHWPGNARELVNVLESALVLSQGGTITPHHLPDRLLACPGTHAGDTIPLAALSLEELARRHIERVVAASRTLEEAAVRLGVNATTLWRKRKRYRMGTAAASPPSEAPTTSSPPTQGADRDGRRTSR